MSKRAPPGALKTRMKRRDVAAELLAQGEIKDWQIAAKIEVGAATLARWKMDPAFMAMVERFRDEIRASIRAEGIANKQNRIDAYNDRWEKLKQIIEERAADDAMVGVPGGMTGLIVKDYRQVGYGKEAELIVTYAVDTGTSGEMRAIEKQAAQELGQWIEKSESTAETAVLGLVGIKIEDL